MTVAILTGYFCLIHRMKPWFALFFTASLFLGVFTQDSKVVVGGALNVFQFFGDLSITMRVAPRNDATPPWIFRHPAPQVFKHSIQSNILHDGEGMAGKFQVDFCKGLTGLYSAFFRGIEVEGLGRAWEGFTKSWTPAVIRNKFKIPEKFQGEHFGYILIRVSHYVETATLKSHSGLSHLAKLAASKVRPEQSSGVLNFIQNFGSHYISSYVIGNSLFQVLVYSEETLKQLKGMLEGKEIDGEEFSNTVFSSYAQFVGPIQSLSGNATLNNWASQAFSTNNFFFIQQNLLQLHRKPQMLRSLRENLGAEALVKLRLKSLDVVLANRPRARRWFKEISHNMLSLYEMNS